MGKAFLVICSIIIKGNIMVMDNLCLFNGTLREHIRFALEIALIVQFFKRTQQTMLGKIAVHGNAVLIL
ncbi:hypothetical protein DW225_15065 [Ruminococcus sp. AM18-44]|nr:hypothetical protein DW225_15065 [Ruminococcus sp. AM18-44]